MPVRKTAADKKNQVEPPVQSSQEQQHKEDNNAPQEAEQRQATIILQPGSCSMLLGLSTDPIPHSLPHIIAYSGSGVEGEEDDSLVLKYPAGITPDLESQREDGLANIRQCLAESRAGLGLLGCEVERGRYSEHNTRVQPVARDSDELALTDVSTKPRFVIGNDALYLPPSAGYLVYKPLRYGRLNTAGGTRSLSSVLNQLEDLWSKAIEEFLDIPQREFKCYRVVLLVSDFIDRAALKEFVNVLLLRLEFAAAFVHQESVCATYSAGLSSGCVVNVGDETIQVCCVEDGMSNANTRVTLKYGGSDITRLFYWLLQQTNFPYETCTPDSRLDGVLIQQLKESVCHLDPSVWGIKEHPFVVMSPTPGTLLDYEIKLADESIVAAMGVFFPSAFCLPDDVVLMTGQDGPRPDPGDLYDEAHWTADGQGGAQGSKASGGGGASKSAASNSGGGGGGGDRASPSGGEASLPEAAKRLRNVAPGKILSIDQAVHLSIDCASSQEMKQKLYGSVLLVGGGLAFPGAAAMVQARLELQLPAAFLKGTDSTAVFSNPRDLESVMVAWKGGAVLSCLDTAQELWLERPEWEFSGVRLLRERAPFQW